MRIVVVAILIMLTIGVVQANMMLAGKEIAKWSGDKEEVKTVHLEKGIKYKVTLNSSNVSWDVFIYKPSNSHYDEVTIDWFWKTADSWADYKIYNDSKEIIAEETGDYKVLIEFYDNVPTIPMNMSYSETKPSGTWEVIVEKLTKEDDPVGPIGGNNSKHDNNKKNWWKTLDDKTKAILFGLGILVIGLAVISLDRRR